MSQIHCPHCQQGPFEASATYCLACGEVLPTETLLRGRYKLVRRIGKGGMGYVYYAEDRTTYDHLCAIKRIPLKTAHGDFEPAQLEREAKILVQVLNTGILGIPDIYDTFTENQCVFVVMKYVEGEQIDAWAVNNKATWSQIVEIVLQASKVVSYLHSLNPPIIHSDIKPGNILRDARGNIWLVDFGFAYIQQDVEDITYVPGFTRSYAPWEQYRLFRPSQAADVYALAMTLYYLLVGPEIFAKRRSASVSDMSKPVDGLCEEDTFLPEWSDSLKYAMLGATRVQPEDRIKIDDFITLLEYALPGSKPRPLVMRDGQMMIAPIMLVEVSINDWEYARKLLQDGMYFAWVRRAYFMDDLATTLEKAFNDAPNPDAGLEAVLNILNTELPAPASGILSKILIPEGEQVEVFAAMGIIEEGGSAAASAPSTAGRPAR